MQRTLVPIPENVFIFDNKLIYLYNKHVEGSQKLQLPQLGIAAYTSNPNRSMQED